jgi:hypothetical protein
MQEIYINRFPDFYDIWKYGDPLAVKTATREHPFKTTFSYFTNLSTMIDNTPLKQCRQHTSKETMLTL